MKDLHKLPSNVKRVPHHTGEIGDSYNGCFILPTPYGHPWEVLRVIASSYPDDDGWDHISVSLEHRIPFWLEMEHVKKLFMGDVVAYQLHMPSKDHINNHPNVLHIWRPWNQVIPVPPPSYV